MLCALSDPSGILYVLVAVIALPFLRHGRSSEPGLRAANMLVILFPTLGAFSTMVFLNILFFGVAWPGEVLIDAFTGIPASLESLLDSYRTSTGWLGAAPVFSAWLVALIVRRPAAILVSAMVFVLISAASVLGAIAPGAEGVTFTLLSLLAITLIPGARTPLENVRVDLVAAVQIAIAWAFALSRPIVVEWMQGIADAIVTVSG